MIFEKAGAARTNTLAESAAEHRPGFETFKSNVCHRVRDMGDLDFIVDALETDAIRKLYDKKRYPECLYLLAMTDYLSRENDLPLCADYNDLRGAKLSNTLYPAGVLGMCAAFDNDDPKEESLREAIPEFLRHNIVESDVRNLA